MENLVVIGLQEDGRKEQPFLEHVLVYVEHFLLSAFVQSSENYLEVRTLRSRPHFLSSIGYRSFFNLDKDRREIRFGVCNRSTSNMD